VGRDARRRGTGVAVVTIDGWLTLAREHFTGEIVFGEDLTTISA
jgi:hypothetical protein